MIIQPHDVLLQDTESWTVKFSYCNYVSDYRLFVLEIEDSDVEPQLGKIWSIPNKTKPLFAKCAAAKK